MDPGFQLTPDEQPFVTVDLERTARGLPPALVLSRSLDAIARGGAQADRDPAIADVVFTWAQAKKLLHIG